MKYGLLVDGEGTNLAIHLTGRRLVKFYGRIDKPDRFEHIQHGIDIELDRADGLLEGKGNGTLGGQVIHFCRPVQGYDLDNLREIRQIAFMQLDLIQYIEVSQSEQVGPIK